VIFWDSSALLPLQLRQPRLPEAHALSACDGDMVAWWGSAIECASAFARRNLSMILRHRAGTVY